MKKSKDLPFRTPLVCLLTGNCLELTYALDGAATPLSRGNGNAIIVGALFR